MMVEEHIYHSVLPAVHVPDGETVYSMVWKAIHEHPTSKSAIVDAFTDERYTYGDVIEKVERLSYHLSEHGVRHGDLMAIYSSNCIELVPLLLALWRIGCVPCMINVLSTPADVNRNLKQTQAEYLFCHENVLTGAAEASRGTTVKKVFVRRDGGHGAISLSSLMTPIPRGRHPPQHTSHQKHTAVILFSSGTTGLPKGVKLCSQSMLMVLKYQKVSVMKQAPSDEVIFQPLVHIYGMGLLNCALSEGRTVYLMPRFHLEIYLKYISKCKCSTMALVPPLAVMLAKSSAVDSYDLSHVSTIVSASAPLSAEVEQLLKRKLGSHIEICQAYGLTETTGLITYMPPREYRTKPAPDGSVGMILPNMQVKIMDTVRNESLGPYKEGEIWCHGPLLMQGYHNNFSATADTIDDKGWLHTGDVGYIDSNGYMFVVDRIKDLIKYNANQVAPAELEAVLLSHPAIADAGVVGLPDHHAGQLPHAWVVLTDPDTSDPDIARQIQKYVADRVSPHKKLRGGVRLVSSIPRSPTGKILRREMVVQIQKESADKRPKSHI